MFEVLPSNVLSKTELNFWCPYLYLSYRLIEEYLGEISYFFIILCTILYENCLTHRVCS